MPLIDVEKLTIQYPVRRNPTLRGLTFSVERGETILLLGPSGCGKSTLALCLNGLIPARVKAEMDGSVRVGGLDSREAGPGVLGLRVGMVFQDPESQFCTLTVSDEVAFGLESRGVPPAAMDAHIDAALGKVGLLNERKRRLDRLSMGEKQRLALACVLAMDPPVLVLDEPTAYLDPEAAQRFYRELTHLEGEHTLILIEHKLDVCIDLIDRVLLLGPDGRLADDGPPREVFARHRRAIDEWGMWVPQVTEVTLSLAASRMAEPPLRLDETVEYFKRRLPLIAPSPEEPPGTLPLNAPGARAFVVDKLSYAYPGSIEKVLDEISLSVPSGDFLALLGPGGAGKTTLAAHLTGILEPPPGKVTLFGFDVNALSLPELTERVGYVFQNPEHQFVTRRTADELAYSLRARTPTLRGRRPQMNPTQRIEELLGMLGLIGLDAADPFTLSQGEKRRLSLGTMLAVNHRMLILDEPMLGQDRRFARALMKWLQDLNRGGVTIVLITQDMRVAAGYTRNAALLIDGKLAYHGPTRALFLQDVLLIRAGLWPPPLFDLTLELQRWQPDFPSLMTVEDYVTAFQGQSAQS